MDIKKNIENFLLKRDINNELLTKALNNDDYIQIEKILQEYWNIHVSHFSSEDYKSLSDILATLDAINYNKDINIKPINIEDILDELEDEENDYEDFENF